MIAARRLRPLFVMAVVIGCAVEPVREPVVTSVTPDRGPRAGGTNVTITGTRFNDITSVTIGGVELEDLTVASSTSITGITPPGANTGAQEIVVTSERRGSGRCGTCFSYTEFPGLLTLRVFTARSDTVRPLGALLIGIAGGPLSGISASGPAIPWSSMTATSAHFIVKGTLSSGTVLATIALPDTQNAVLRLYTATVVQAASIQSWGYQQIPSGDYLVSIGRP